MPPIDTLAVLGLDLPVSSVAKLRAAFKVVHYRPDFTLPRDLRGEVDMVFANWRALPPDVDLDECTRLKHIQLSTAGADMCIRVSPAIRELAQRKLSNGVSPSEGLTLSNASGIHVLSIPNWVTANVIVLYHQLQVMMANAREKKKWVRDDVNTRPQEIEDIEPRPNGNENTTAGGAAGAPGAHGSSGYFARSTHGRTAGMLGYGALGRATARLLKAHGMRIIAANTRGEAGEESEYVIPGTGDLDGSIPDAYFSTKDPASFEAFLRETDVLVCSVPSTPATQWLLNADKLALLKRDAPLFINVGRGDLIKSDELVKALDAPLASGGLFGAAIDVTDPEPLPDNHPLWTHPRAIVTPHLSGNVEGELALGADIAIANAERIRQDKTPYNVVDLQKGY